MQWIVCPACAENAWQPQGDAVRCGACGQPYLWRGDILDLLPDGPHFLTLAQRSNFTWPVAWGYEKLWRRRSLTLLSGQPFGLPRELALLTGWLAGAGPGLFLDLACSHGLYARALAHDAAARGLARELIALDSSPSMLQQAARRVRTEDLSHVHLLCAEGEQLPLAANSLDGVVCGGSLNEFQVADLVVAEAARALKPGAPFFSMHLLASERPGPRLLQRLAGRSGIRFWTAAGVQALFAQRGLVQQRSEQFGLVQFALYTKG